MISMTGYGYSEFQDEKRSCSLEIKTYNNRYLDTIINMPGYLGPLESYIRESLSKVLRRGRVEFFLKIREKEENLNLLVDQAAAENYKSSLQKLADSLDLSDGVSLSHILSMDGVVKVEKIRDVESFRPLISELLDTVLAQLTESRQREGAHTRQDILKHLDTVKEFHQRVEELAPKVEAEVTAQLKNKFTEIMGDAAEESRILAEVAAYLVRYDINEEISRLAAHLSSFDHLCQSSDPLGKKLDFLCQEMNREINTIGSKSPQVEVHRLVVDAKDAMEKIREQLRNVE